MKKSTKPPNRDVIASSDLLKIKNHDIPRDKVDRGKITNKQAVPLSDGKSIIYIEKGRDPEQARLNYENKLRERRVA